MVLGVKDKQELIKFGQKLDDAGLKDRMWVEQVRESARARAFACGCGCGVVCARSCVRACAREFIN